MVQQKHVLLAKATVHSQLMIVLVHGQIVVLTVTRHTIGYSIHLEVVVLAPILTAKHKRVRLVKASVHWILIAKVLGRHATQDAIDSFPFQHNIREMEHSANMDMVPQRLVLLVKAAVHLISIAQGNLAHATLRVLRRIM